MQHFLQAIKNASPTVTTVKTVMTDNGKKEDNLLAPMQNKHLEIKCLLNNHSHSKVVRYLLTNVD